jgi:hypothetical protein
VVCCFRVANQLDATGRPAALPGPPASAYASIRA